MSDLSAKIHRGIFGKSDDPTAAENQNKDFLDGYDAGEASARDGLDAENQETWRMELQRRGGNECDWERFREWKRGWHAARLRRTLDAMGEE